MKDKKKVIAVVVLVAILAVMIGLYAMTQQKTVEGAKTITVTVVHGDGTEKTFTYTSTSEYLGPVLIAERLVDGEEGPYGLTINTVDGETASWEENQSYWALYIGDEYATTGADTTPIYDGSTFKLVYTIG